MLVHVYHDNPVCPIGCPEIWPMTRIHALIKPIDLPGVKITQKIQLDFIRPPPFRAEVPNLGGQLVWWAHRSWPKVKFWDALKHPSRLHPGVMNIFQAYRATTEYLPAGLPPPLFFKLQCTSTPTQIDWQYLQYLVCTYSISSVMHIKSPRMGF